MVHIDFEKRSQNQHFQSTLLVRNKKEYCVYALDMLTILDDRFCSSSSDGNTSVEDELHR